MNQYSGLCWQIDPIEFCNIQRDTDREFVRITVKILEVEFYFVDGTATVDFVLQFNFVSLQIEYDTRLRLSKVADAIEFLAQRNFINRCLCCEIQIARKSGIRKIGFAKAVPTFQHQFVGQRARRIDSEKQP